MKKHASKIVDKILYYCNIPAIAGIYVAFVVMTAVPKSTEILPIEKLTVLLIAFVLVIVCVAWWEITMWLKKISNNCDVKNNGLNHRADE